MLQANFAATPAFVHALPGVPYHPARGPERTLDHLLPLAIELERPLRIRSTLVFRRERFFEYFGRVWAAVKLIVFYIFSILSDA